MTKVFAFDLSLTATGVADDEGNLETVRPSAKGDRRLHEIAMLLVHRVLEGDPLFVAIEGPVVRSSAAVAIGMLQGAVRFMLLAEEIPYLVVPPATVKTYATGRGNATKPDMRMELFKRTGLDVSDDNQVDAWWLRALGMDLADDPVVDLPQTHRRALAKLTIPSKETP